MNAQNIEARALITQAECTILDVRTAMEHRQCCLKTPHLHVPLDELDPAKFMNDNGLGAEKPVYLLCQAGRRAAMAAEKFRAAGFGNVHVIEGGIAACESCGVPLARSGKDVISLERQVRIAAGALVLLGVVLGWAGAPVFYLLSGFVGAGLIFAGVTDRCGMAMLLAGAPWNK